MPRFLNSERPLAQQVLLRSRSTTATAATAAATAAATCLPSPSRHDEVHWAQAAASSALQAQDCACAVQKVFDGVHQLVAEARQVLADVRRSAAAATRRPAVASLPPPAAAPSPLRALVTVTFDDAHAPRACDNLSAAVTKINQHFRGSAHACCRNVQVHLQAGTYVAPAEVVHAPHARVSFVGSGSCATTIDGPLAVDAGEDITLQHLHLRGGFSARDVTALHIEDVYMHSLSSAGLEVQSVQRLTMRRVHTSHSTVRVRDAQTVVVQHCVIENSPGIAFQGLNVLECNFHASSFSNCRGAAVHLTDARSVTLQSITARNCNQTMDTSIVLLSGHERVELMLLQNVFHLLKSENRTDALCAVQIDQPGIYEAAGNTTAAPQPLLAASAARVSDTQEF